MDDAGRYGEEREDTDVKRFALIADKQTPVLFWTSIVTCGASAG